MVTGTGTESNVSRALTLGTWFDLKKTRLRAPARLRRERSIRVKAYDGILKLEW